MEKIFKESFQNEISVRQTRLIINVKFRMGKSNLSSILKEMSEMKLIAFKDHQTLTILWKPKD